jgi:hypothetical protein
MMPSVTLDHEFCFFFLAFSHRTSDHESCFFFLAFSHRTSTARLALYEKSRIRWASMIEVQGGGKVPGKPIHVVDDDRPGPCSLHPLGQALEPWAACDATRSAAIGP